MEGTWVMSGSEKQLPQDLKLALAQPGVRDSLVHTKSQRPADAHLTRIRISPTINGKCLPTRCDFPL
jgi:hypothetical protein